MRDWKNCRLSWMSYNDLIQPIQHSSQCGRQSMPGETKRSNWSKSLCRTRSKTWRQQLLRKDLYGIANTPKKSATFGSVIWRDSTRNSRRCNASGDSGKPGILTTHFYSIPRGRRRSASNKPTTKRYRCCQALRATLAFPPPQTCTALLIPKSKMI